MPKRRNQKKGQAVEEDEGSPDQNQNQDRELEGAEAPTGNDETLAAGPTPPKEPTPPVKVLYCEVCSLPAEYCEFGSSLTKCMKWLEDAHPDVWRSFYSEDALAKKASALTIEQATKLAADTAKKESKADAKARIEQEKKKDRKVVIRRVERGRRKWVTVVSGLEGFGIELKAASKLFAQKFATGASVSKAPPGSTHGSAEEIVIQGDVAYDVEEMFGEGKGLFKDLDEDAVEVVEGKK